MDDFSRYTWAKFIRENFDTFEVIKEMCHILQREKGTRIVRIKSDHGIEFYNSKFSKFLLQKVLDMSFQHQSLHGKMGWWKGKP